MRVFVMSDFQNMPTREIQNKLIEYERLGYSWYENPKDDSLNISRGGREPTCPCAEDEIKSLWGELVNRLYPISEKKEVKKSSLDYLTFYETRDRLRYFMGHGYSWKYEISNPEKPIIYSYDKKNNNIPSTPIEEGREVLGLLKKMQSHIKFYEI